MKLMHSDPYFFYHKKIPGIIFPGSYEFVYIRYHLPPIQKALFAPLYFFFTLASRIRASNMACSLGVLSISACVHFG